MNPAIAGKNIILTGANRGIGSHILTQLAANGANIWACARTQNAAFEETAAALAEQYHVWVKPVYFDLADEAALREVVQSIIKEKLPIDGLVNNAGVPHGGLLTMTPISKLREVFDVNYFAQIQMMQLVARVMMRQKSGSIVNMASVGGIETQPGYLAYGSSKAALIWATKSISKELGGYGIRVNAVAPGLTHTQMGHYKTEEELEKVVRRTSLQRMAEPDEIAKAVLYLLGDDASFVTGHILVVDGGRV